MINPSLAGCPFHHGSTTSSPARPGSPSSLPGTPTPAASTPQGADAYHGQGCPVGAEGSEDVLAPGRDLAPDHHWLAKPKVHTPVPVFTPDQWKSAQHYDVVVVGGGMSGLNTAWRLRGLDGSTPPPGQTQAPSVAIFERTHHIGGRARTFKIQGDQTPLDLGAMRFIPSEQPLVNNLAQHFHLQTRDFVVGGDKNLEYFRGTRLTNAEAAAHPEELPFHLRPEEQGKSADQLLAMGIEAVVPNFTSLSAEQWELVKKTTTLPVLDPSTGQTSQVPLAEMGLQDVLARTLSHEALALVTDSVGYQSFLANWDAGEALEAISNDFKPGTEYKTPVDGMAAFPISLIKDLRANGVPVNKEQTLRQVAYDATAQEFHLVFEDSQGTATPVVCKQTVLAMPKGPLAEVTADSPFLQGTPLEQNLDKVTANPMTRIFVTYDKPWWNEDGITGGRSRTDLPLGQVYYYGDSKDARPYIEIYNDGSNSEFFEGLQNPENSGVNTTLTASPQLAQEIQKEISELHGHATPAPTGFLYKRWADDYFGGAYHTWNAGSDPSSTSEAMIAPLPQVPLYVCGEAYSTNQGWIEGALETSEKVLAHMGKGAPHLAEPS